MEMRRSERAAKFQARHSNDAHEHRHLAFALARTTPGLVLMILVGAAAVFFLLPRMSAGHLGGYSFGSDLSTGFSDRVQLGQIGQIQQSQRGRDATSRLAEIRAGSTRSTGAGWL